MKPRVLLTGATGYIGRNLYNELKDEMEIYALSKYPVNGSDTNIHWITGDLFSLSHLTEAMKHVDFAVYFVDPTKRSSKLNDANFKDMNAISADNFARAAELNNLKEIIYIAGTNEDEETIGILSRYKTPVRVTETKVRRKGMIAQSQSSDVNDVRSIQRTMIPHNWSIRQATEHYFEWLNEMAFNFVQVIKEDDEYIVTVMKKKMLSLKRYSEHCDENRELYLVTGGMLAKQTNDNRARLDFRRLKDTDILIIALHDYEPTIPWLLYLISQAPIHHLTMKIFDIEMRIAKFQEEQKLGSNKTYTKK